MAQHPPYCMVMEVWSCHHPDSTAGPLIVSRKLGLLGEDNISASKVEKVVQLIPGAYLHNLADVAVLQADAFCEQVQCFRTCRLDLKAIVLRRAGLACGGPNAPLCTALIQISYVSPLYTPASAASCRLPLLPVTWVV